MNLWLLIAVILLVLGLAGYFLGKKETAGLNEDSGKVLLVIGVIGGITFLMVYNFAG